MARARRDEGRDDTRVRSGELAALCRVDRVQLARALARYGVATTGGWVDLIEIARAVVSAERSRGKSSDTDDPGRLQIAKLQGEVANLEARRDWIRTRIKTLRREYVRVGELQEKLTRVSAALLRAGEQLGRRFGPEAQELFNSALDAGVRAITGGSSALAKRGAKRRGKGNGKRS